MKYDKRGFSTNRPLSTVEIAALAREVLERARHGLKEKRQTLGLPALAEKPADASAPPSLKPVTRVGANFTMDRRGDGSALARQILGNFEYLTIGTCLILAATAWIINL